MRIVFADASYWIALLNPRDELHGRARHVSDALGRVRTVTSETVLTEVLNGLAKGGAALREKAVQLVRELQGDPETEVVPQSAAEFEDALLYYEARKDKPWGLTDCSSFQIMKEREIGEALASDHHFVQAGFRALLRGDG